MHDSLRIPLFEGSAWLSDLLAYAAEQRVCTRTNCTTCGATSFRQALWRAAEWSNPSEPVDAILQQLRSMVAPSEGLRLVLYEVYRRGGQNGLEDLQSGFADTPAAREYSTMKAHFVASIARRQRHSHSNDPEKVAAARAAKKADRATRHQERLAAKAARDAANRAAG